MIWLIRETPAELLAAGYATLRQCWPSTVVTFRIGEHRYRARFELPGRLIVSRWYDGTVLVRSLAGRPGTPEKVPRVRRSGYKGATTGTTSGTEGRR